MKCIVTASPTLSVLQPGEAYACAAGAAGSSIERATLLVANAIMVPVACPEPELAAAFCKIAVRSDIQDRISRTSGFLSVLRGINESVWDKAHLQAIRLGDARLDRCLFVHEAFPDSAFISEMDYELGLFWAGLETADAAAERLLRIRSREGE